MVCVIKQWITWEILEINKKYYLKWASKPRFMSQKILDNDLVTTRKSKVTLKLNKPAYVGMCLLQLVLMHKSHHDYIKIYMVTKQDYYLLMLIFWCMKLKTQVAYEDFLGG